MKTDRRVANIRESETGDRIIDSQKSRYPVRSPLWWVDRLYTKLKDRLEKINIYDDYYRGEFPLPWLAPQAEEDFRRILRMSRANYCGLVIDAMVERMAIEGFRIDTGKGKESTFEASLEAQARKVALGQKLTPGTIGTTKSQNFVGTSVGEADRETWRIWQHNHMDTLFDQALLEAAVNGMSYIMIAPNNEDRSTPRIWVEHPSQCIVEHKSGTQRREVIAGLKVWEDDIDNVICATLYLPGEIHKYQAKRTSGTAGLRPKWEPRIIDGEEWPAQTTLDFVPIYEIPNNPRLLTGGNSEIYDVLDSQDRIVKTIADRLMTQDYGAFPQKWAKAWPEEDASGRPTPPIPIGRTRIITTDVAEADFGQFDAAELSGYMLAKKEDVHDIAARTRTPAQYLLGEFSNVNGETLKASESGLVAKTRQRMRGVDDVVEMIIHDVRKVAGIASDDAETVESVWRNPEFKTEGELVDSLLKMGTLKVPTEALWERWGATPQEIIRWREMNLREAEIQMRQEMSMLNVMGDAYRSQSADDGGDSQSAKVATRGPGGRLTGSVANEVSPMEGEILESLKPQRKRRKRPKREYS